MQQQNNSIEKKLDEFIERAEPMVKTFENLSWTKKALLSLAIFVSALLGVGIAIKTLFK
jgi:hypothetical protein